VELEEIRKNMLSGKSIEEILEKFDWKKFEDLVAEIFRKNEFKVKQSFWFRTKRKYEIDIVAIKGSFVLCIDCKEWGKKRYKKTGLKYAAKNQEKRVKEFIKFIKNNRIIQDKLEINPNCKFFPLLVTLFEEDLIKENNVFVVPVYKLNTFLIEGYI
jgi:Holliday junction resolvase